MGRLKKYHTEEEIRLANSIKANRYYYKNKHKVDKIARDKYRKSKNNGNSISAQEEDDR